MASSRYAVIVGFHYYGRFLSRLINEHATNWHARYFSSTRFDTARALLHVRRADALISFGGPSPNFALVEAARHHNVPVIVIWAGSDVLAAQRDPQLLEVIKSYDFTNVCDGPWLVDELRAFGITSRYVPVTAVDAAAPLTPLPETFSVLTYLPQPRRAFYGERSIYQIARDFPEIPFRVVGPGERNPIAPKNVHFLGYSGDMPRHIDESTVILRLPEHDGKSMLVLEALARGRHVIWNYEFPTVHYAPRTIDAAHLLADLRARHENGTLDVNRAGHALVQTTFTPSQLVPPLEALLDETFARRRTPKEGPRHRAAISGLHLFGAHIAEALPHWEPAWAPQILRTRARLEVLTSMIDLLSCDVWYSIGSPIGDRWLHLFSRALRKPRVIHWVGSDITALRANPRLRAICSLPHVRNLAEVDWTKDELRAMGLEASVAPLPPRLPALTPPPLPERFTVLLYLPQQRSTFYGRREYERLIRTFSEKNVRFIVVGGGEFYAPPDADVERLGWCTSLQDVYARSSVLIRFTPHDGLSLMILEALTYGRHVIWTQPFAHTTTVQEYDGMERAVQDLLERHKRGTLDVQHDAARFVTQTYSTERCIKAIVAAWNDACARKPGTQAVVEAT